MTTSTKSETAAKKDVTKLQRAIVDGLEDVKAQDIQVFNTEHLSPLFERVIVASGTSNRQTKALAASVRDAVKEAGFSKPRIEGEDNGEWIIVDCGPAVAHIMQPAIRQYYRLEELWGDTPVRLKLGAAKPEAAAKKKAPAKKAAAEAAVPARKPGKPKVAAVAPKAAEAKPKAAAKKAPASKTPASKTAGSAAAKAPAAKKPAAKKAPVKTVVVKPTAKKPAAKKPAATKAAAKPAVKPAAKKAPARAKKA
jgi:ribosome-associated protein